MKNEIEIYVAPRIEEFELAVESGIAQSTGSVGGSNSISEYVENDQSSDASFWQ